MSLNEEKLQDFFADLPQLQNLVLKWNTRKDTFIAKYQGSSQVRKSNQKIPFIPDDQPKFSEYLVFCNLCTANPNPKKHELNVNTPTRRRHAK